MILYKITDVDYYTRRGMDNGIHWEIGVPQSAKEGTPVLCTHTVIHAYESLELAYFMNPAHAGIGDPIYWEAEGNIIIRDGLKVGVKTLTLTKKLPNPQIPITANIAFGILCAKQVYNESSWNKWADNWLSNKDRTKAAAYSAVNKAAYSAADAAAKAAAKATTYSAADAAAKAAAKATTYAAADVAKAVAYSVVDTADTADTDAANKFDFISIAKEALAY